MTVIPPFHNKASKEAAEHIQHARDELAAAAECVDEIDRLLAEAAKK